MITKKLPMFAFLDVETTGLSSSGTDRICEIAVLKWSPGKTEETFNSLIDPMRPISKGASMVNAITDDMLKSAPVFRHVAPKVLEFLENSVLVCHNAPFDLGFLSREFNLCNMRFPDRPILDTLKIARRHFTFPSNKLSEIAEHLGIEVTQKHRALADVILTKKIFCHFLDNLPQKGVDDISELYCSWY